MLTSKHRVKMHCSGCSSWLDMPLAATSKQLRQQQQQPLHTCFLAAALHAMNNSVSLEELEYSIQALSVNFPAGAPGHPSVSSTIRRDLLY